jgi:hypothetical protein
MIDRAEFLNTLKVLRGLDRHELERFGVIPHGAHSKWYLFRDDVLKFLFRADDDVMHNLWRLVEHRITNKPVGSEQRPLVTIPQLSANG